MREKTKPFKVNLTDGERKKIEAARTAAGYKSVSAYMRDSALGNAPVHLLEIAREMGKLGQIVNEILASDIFASGTGGSYGDDAKKAARRIIKACDAVTAALRME